MKRRFRKVLNILIIISILGIIVLEIPSFRFALKEIVLWVCHLLFYERESLRCFIDRYWIERILASIILICSLIIFINFLLSVSKDLAIKKVKGDNTFEIKLLSFLNSKIYNKCFL